MLFPTVTFAVFFAIVLPLNWLLLPRGRVWSVFIIVASYVFYGWWDPRFVFLLAGMTLWNQLMAVVIDRAQGRARSARLAIAVAGDLAVLGYFKYADFFLVSVHNGFARLGLDVGAPVLEVTLPVGISFFTFQALSYVIDVKRGIVRPAPLIDFAVYLSFFPHLIAGPIVRARELLPQIFGRHDPRRVDVSGAFFLIISGLFKKVVLSDLLSTRIVDPVFAAPSLHSGLETLVAVYAYAAQIYCDFSGYTDIAIGLAILLGFQFPQNFNAPYTAVGFRDFWRRWHMTLSRFLRDYLYIPLGGNRKGRLRTYANLMATMLLGGLWHGASWTFVIWGGLQGGALSGEHLWIEERDRRGWQELTRSRARRWVARVLTFNVICLGWIFFRAGSMATATAVLGRLIHGWGEPSPLVTRGVVLATIAGIGVQYVPAEWFTRLKAAFSQLGPVEMGLALGLSLLVISVLGPSGVAPFIYYAF
jgi:alginate O-acetyltransferase complex protein AlgI